MKDGGTAFPVIYVSKKEGSSGMTLRDYFAAQALTGVIKMGRGHFDGTGDKEYIAEKEV